MMLLLNGLNWRKELNKIYLFIILFVCYPPFVAKSLEVDGISEFNEIDSNFIYERVQINNLCLQSINKNIKIKSKIVKFEQCFLDKNELKEILNWSILEELEISNSIILDDTIDLSYVKNDFIFTLNNIQRKIKLIGLNNLSFLKVIDSYNITFNVNELTDNLKVLHLENINFPSLDNINELNGLEELAIVGYGGKLEISGLSRLSLLSLGNLNNFPVINNINTLENLWLTDLSVVDTSSVQAIIKLNNSTLESIWLTNLKLENIPNEVYNCNQLNTLVLNNNSITNIGLEVLKLNNLVNLSVSNNNLKYIDKSIFSLKKLSDLDIKGNNISNIDEIKFLNKSIYIHSD